MNHKTMPKSTISTKTIRATYAVIAAILMAARYGFDHARYLQAYSLEFGLRDIAMFLGWFAVCVSIWFVAIPIALAKGRLRGLGFAGFCAFATVLVWKKPYALGSDTPTVFMCGLRDRLEDDGCTLDDLRALRRSFLRHSPSSESGVLFIAPTPYQPASNLVLWKHLLDETKIAVWSNTGLRIEERASEVQITWRYGLDGLMGVEVGDGHLADSHAWVESLRLSDDIVLVKY